MQYYSLQRQSPPVDFATAAVEGQAPDKGLYYPSTIPQVDGAFIDDLPALSLVDVAETVMQPFTEGSLPGLREILREALSFEIPLVPLSGRLSVLELFHGPTLAFKDVGARFMSRCLARILGVGAGGESRRVTVLVATSGDTGGAVAAGFEGVGGVRVVILYPKGKVSRVQELQLTTCGADALEVDGTFDDCQRLVKQAFADTGLKAALGLTSANSINVARWLPQQIYYWWAYRGWPHAEPPVFIVPSGNFGNVCAGVLAHRMGLPVHHFLAACNANDTIPRFLSTGRMDPHPAVATMSNAMDVAVPSNFVRVLELLGAGPGSDHTGLHQKLSAVSVDDAATVAALTELYHDYGYLADPHTGVGYHAWKEYSAAHPDARGVLLSTAHPVKFAPVLGFTPPVPEAIQALEGKAVRKTPMPAGFSALKGWLEER